MELEVENKIVLHWDKEKGMWTVFAKDGRPILDNVKDFISKTYKEDDLFDDYKTLRTARTNINNKNKELAKARKQALNVMFGDIQKQLMECESLLEKVSCEITEKLELCSKEEI